MCKKWRNKKKPLKKTPLTLLLLAVLDVFFFLIPHNVYVYGPSLFVHIIVCARIYHNICPARASRVISISWPASGGFVIRPSQEGRLSQNPRERETWQLVFQPFPDTFPGVFFIYGIIYTNIYTYTPYICMYVRIPQTGHAQAVPTRYHRLSTDPFFPQLPYTVPPCHQGFFSVIFSISTPLSYHLVVSRTRTHIYRGIPSLVLQGFFFNRGKLSVGLVTLLVFDPSVK